MSWTYAGDCPQCRAPRYADDSSGRPVTSYSCQCEETRTRDEDRKARNEHVPSPLPLVVADEVAECQRLGGHVIVPQRWPLPAPVNPTQAHIPYDSAQCIRMVTTRDGTRKRCNVTVVLEYGRHAPELPLPYGVAQILTRGAPEMTSAKK